MEVGVLAGIVRLGAWWVWATVNIDVGFGWPVGDGRGCGVLLGWNGWLSRERWKRKLAECGKCRCCVGVSEVCGRSAVLAAA